MIDPTREMIVIKGEIKTSSVQSCIYNKNTKKWDVTFNNDKMFSYAYSNVEKMRNPSVLDLQKVRLTEGEKPLYEVKAVHVFSNGSEKYYHVTFENGYKRDFTNGEIQVRKSVFKTEKNKDVWDYFKKIIEVIELFKENGEPILKKQFDKIDFIDEECALNPYLNCKAPLKRKARTPIFPFGCNTSQYEAVEKAINNQLSVIQGPPGTGKTQTILNILSNLLVEGKTVQIVSNNNSAIENVQEKLSSPKYELDFFVAKLGKADNKKSFVQEQKAEYPDFSKWIIEGNVSKLRSEIKELSQQLKIVYSEQEQIARLTLEKSDIEIETKHFNEYVKKSAAKTDLVKIRKNKNSDTIMRLWQIWQNNAENNTVLSIWQKMILIFRYGLKDFSIYKYDSAEIITSLQSSYYQKRLSEIDEEVDKLNSDIKKQHVDTEELTDKSMKYFKHVMATRYSKKTSRKIFSEDDFWKKPQEVLEEYPVTLSTTYASKSSLGSTKNLVQYDYLIMDEASQVDVATGVLSLSSTKNAVIVGDTKQLPNVVKGEAKEKAEAIFKRYDVPEGYRYTNSFLKSITEIVPEIPTTLLREHYRCHPKIINFCNKKFYSDELLIMTRDNNEQNVLKAITTVVGNHERDHLNQRQIDVIKKEIIPELGDDLSSVGIIAPYKNQVEAIAKEFPNIDVSTVHKFQGKEKDTIIISTVDNEKTDFSDDPYLINVAVSRAKKRLYVVASGNELEDGNIRDLLAYIRYNNCEVVESKVYSIFDYLYKHYTEARLQYLSGKRKISEIDSENLMYTLLTETLSELGRNDIGIVCRLPLKMIIRNTDKLNEEETRYAMNPATHLDFILYKKTGKQILAGIEVDGYSYHKEGTKQAERDKLKDVILKKYDIQLLRFSTTGSGEKDRIVELVNQVHYL